MIHFLHSSRLKEFFKLEAAGGLVLFAATIAALCVANSPLYDFYNYFLIDKHAAHWINDGLMAIFFFVVGLEIKREFKEGELSSVKSASVPFVAAIFGIIVPGLIFYLINMNDADNLRGIAIPTATDIAFSLGVLALLGSRAPFSLKVLLTAIAIIDDLAAILIIAIFYTGDINFYMLGGASCALAMMMMFNKFNIKGLWPYLALGFVMWIALLNSGLHPTMAGVATAFCIPVFRKFGQQESWIDHLIHKLHPYTAFFILPVFAFANAGVNFTGMNMSDFTSPLTLGIVAGLVAGKTIGITGALAILRPGGVNFLQMIGLGFLCGIGFTMSLFIGELAFTTNELQNQIRLGVMSASLISALCAFGILRFASK
ncbi:MAG: Na+/H+ antiporter NhaA [Micavibrio aeruginosavorus]|uniref:Na(+)/H(+) antiporter NhaA n=1 Tax=Micavibrio aeruginosavorus TaxID=349221 RepID=A0A2W5FLB5_9BACT|nr:MAG: Na+/H+ antiporter NhaA [Micavibrio aeruginosavorus]